ncbi:MAG: c-type cytochrome [Paracoccaceae bacterium]
MRVERKRQNGPKVTSSVLTRLVFISALLGFITGFGALVLLMPPAVQSSEIQQLPSDAARGAKVFYASGCGSCHSTPTAAGEAALQLGGGQSFVTPYGVFRAPNISMSQNFGIGRWDFTDFETALRRGISPMGEHYFPAFPYTAYQHMTLQDVSDLWMFWQGLPAVETVSPPHELQFPFGFRRLVGLWKLFVAAPDWHLKSPLDGGQERGRYLVEALGHCAECHTPRNALGGLRSTHWLAGAENPSGKGRIPNITPAALQWSLEEIADYLETGLTPDFDVVGGSMAKVVDNLAKLSPEDRLAIAQYLKALPSIPTP